ncbi:MAG: MOSC N-terminal beta barrel domain-containing protein, partial [Nitrospira sp.]|nr:MOSC N-terminal beta barrel domain-containing protein [Nitrospira sp.]
MPLLDRITIYPIKSLDGVTVTEAKILPSGALEYDREFAIFSEQGNFVNGKRNEKVHLLRSLFDAKSRTITLQIQGAGLQRSFQAEEG